ncbi:M24 family metallopeptidase [Paenibacillus humicola]|uniref:M24 family metallopeptidase n=1 Tax=Paenibacillus humicola TaxID=3110540 RepID=UPI00237BC266|nr:Xaa-Pro peptidase family protein [Paenibacillus humicola]
MANVRVAGVKEKLASLQIDGLLVTNPVNRRYLSGFTGTSGYLLISGGGNWLLTDFRYMTQASDQASGFTVVKHGTRMIDSVKELAASAGIKKLGFEQEHVVFADYAAWKTALDGVELVPVSGIVEQLRVIKDTTELAIMRDAAALADETFRHILGFIQPGVRETDVALEMETYMRARGASSTSFQTIVASGERSALPHGVASDKVIGKGELVTLDFGAYFGGYCSDLTRTVMVGAPSDRHKEIYDIVLEAQLTALAGIKPGMTGREADALARDVIVKYGYGEQFGHSTGHGLGIEIHEEPRLSANSDQSLEPGMTVTVEPGIYIPGFGGVRIEDDIVITPDGNALLTSSPKEFIVLG